MDMNHQDAFDALEIDFSETKYEEVTMTFLTKQYRKMALKYHPDKNGNTEESTERFKRVNTAYHYLKRELGVEEEDDMSANNEDQENEQNFVYMTVLKNFVRSVFENKGVIGDIIMKIVHDILVTGKQISLRLFEDVDKDTVLNIYNFLSTYRNTLHFPKELLDSMRQIVLDKYDSVEIYKLNPSINDLMDNNLYKLYIDEQLYLVPLWHSECYFDCCNGSEVIVICEPELPDCMHIDDDNNLYVETEISAWSVFPEMVLNNVDICIQIGNRPFVVPLAELRMKREQSYKFKKQGITKVKKDIYDVSDKSDIIVRITLV
jgi:hypothetical protein